MIPDRLHNLLAVIRAKQKREQIELVDEICDNDCSLFMKLS